jgi:hypothetical protein
MHVYETPVIDNKKTDWFGKQGREQDGWTAIQFERLVVTCDSMDVPIKVKQIIESLISKIDLMMYITVCKQHIDFRLGSC